MQNLKVPGGIDNVGASQGYQGISVRWSNVFDPATNSRTIQATTHWYPTPEQLIRLLDGAPIELSMLGGQAPMIIDVGPVPEILTDEEPYEEVHTRVTSFSREEGAGPN